MIKISESVWRMIAWVVSREPIANYLIQRARRTPYFNLPGYMDRDWLFNPYDQETHRKKYEWLPSIRIHHILRADVARHPHDHPWDARTIILKGKYTERRMHHKDFDHWFSVEIPEWFSKHERNRADTATINHDQYHSIDEVSEGGVFTMFITYKFRGGWGFWVDGKKMPWREYEEKYPT